MRTDLTVRTTAGTEHDLAVLAPDGTTWQAARPAVEAALAGLCDAGPRWCGQQPLTEQLALGNEPLVTGAVLTDAREAAPVITSARLEVIGGHDCGASATLRDGLSIGRDPACALVLTDPAVSRRHAVVSATPAGFAITDLGSTTGVHLGDRRVRTAVLTDVRPIRIGANLLALTQARPRPALAAAPDVTLPDPPDRAPVPIRTPLSAVVLPMLLAGLLAWLSGSWEFLGFAALGPLGALASARADRSRSRRALRRAEDRFGRELARAESAVADGLHAEVIRRRSRHPHPSAVLRDAAGSGESAADPGDTGLVVRVGLGSVASQLRSVRGGTAQPAGQVCEVPVTVDLAAGPLGLAGPAELVTGLACWLVAQLVGQGLHPHWTTAPDDPCAWHWLRWCPPIGADLSLIEVADRPLTPPPGHAIVVADDPRQLPPWCVSTVVVADETAATVRVRTPGQADADALADRVGPAWCEALARLVAGRRALPDRRPADLPETCRLSEVVPLADPDTVRRRWALADGTARVPIGMDGHGPIVIDLDKDGPHALIAGSTGSGKSELLQALVVGSALAHPPDQMTFLLLDYKGGAAFAECAGLPHTVGVLTDLDQRLTGRVLHSLDSEVRRRERLLAAVGAADLHAYRRSGPAVPLARLVIVVDEFATLAEELGSFVTGLVGIARRGRSLGLHLVLATQRPAGVVSPEIRANCALRICLRVTDAADSLDVVDTEAAAAISPTTPGRAYLRRDGRADAVQLAGLSGPVPDTDDGVRVMLLDEAHLLPENRRTAETELQRAVALVRAAADQAPGHRPHRPWLPPLPERLDLAELPAATDGTTVLGLVDRPDEQAQPPLTIDLTMGGTVVLTGRGGSGRSTALHTIARAAAAACAPSELHVYAIDAGGHALSALRALPHIGTVATAADGFDFTAGLVARLAAAPPADRILLLVDGWDQLVAASDDHDGGRTTERLLALARDACAARSTVVITGGRATLAPRLTGVATARFVLALTDPADYLAAGVAAAAIPANPPPGRAIRIGDGAEVQFAVAPGPIGDSRPPNSALRLRPLPRQVSLAALAVPAGTICLGVGGDQAAPLSVDLVGSNARLLVAGPHRSGRSTLLATVLAQSGEDCAVIASARSPLAAHARNHGVLVLQPTAESPYLPPVGLVIVDDVEQVTDTPLGDALDSWLAADAAGPRAAVVAGRTDALAVGYRGLIARLRSACCGIVLHPAPGDAAVLAVGVPGSRAARPPGRGVLVPDPGWRIGTDPLPIQVAVPGEVGAS